MSLTGLFGRELRARFANDGATNAIVDGSRVPCEALSVRSMNFGQHWRGPHASSCRYSLELPVTFFVACLAEPGALPSLIADVKNVPDPTDPLDHALIAAGFPNAEDAAQHPVLAQCLADFFAHDLLLRWLGDAGPEVQPGFVLNSCEKILFGPSGLLIEGECRSSDSSRAYQDR